MARSDDDLLDAPLQDVGGRTTTLRDERGGQATVVVFVRHFG
jgi:hypothetical protein